MKINIITDSVCDLPVEIAREHDIDVVPVYINLEGQSYLDGIELSRHEFYSRLPHTTSSPTTAAPGPGVFVEAYEKAARKGAEAILSIHVAESLSTTINAARTAVSMFSKIPVWVVDSGQLSLGLGIQAIAAAKAALSGQTVEVILKSLNELRKRTYVYAVVDTLEYLRRSGRVERYKAKLGAMVRLKPIIKFHDGQISMEMAVTTSRAIRRMREIAVRHAPLQHLSFVHSLASKTIADLQQLMATLNPLKETSLVTEVTPAIGTHIGPGAAGMVLVQS